MAAGEEILSPRSAAEFISNSSADVKIRSENIQKVAKVVLEGLQTKNFQLADWKGLDINPKVANEAAIDWIFFVDTLNFSFWTDNPTEHFTVTYNGVPYTGYFALCAAVCNALKDGKILTTPQYYASITKDELKTLLISDSGLDIPLLEERHRILQETGGILIKKFGGTFVNCVRESKSCAQSLISLVVNHFPSYRDEATYKTKNVAFYKRVQILVADIWACFEGKGLGHFKDIDTITMFADYRIPQVLAHLGLLKYSEDLNEKLKKGIVLVSKSDVEIEIRGCSIWAVEVRKLKLQKLIKEALNNMISANPNLYDADLPINSIMIDFFLWEYRRKYASSINATPFHRVRSIYY